MFLEALKTFKAINSAGIRLNIFTPNYCLSPNFCSLRDVPVRTLIILDTSCKSSLRLFKQVLNFYILYYASFLVPLNRSIDTGINGCFWT